MKPFTLAACLIGLAAPAPGEGFDTMEALGEALFNDAALSANRTQSCATCHNPDFAFTDPRETDAGLAVSLGDDGASLGDRNAPTAAYAMFSPRFEQLDPGIYRGGQFLDGREPDLEGQAGGPPLNPIEMGMPDKASVVARLRENPDYIDAFATLFGRDVWNETDAAYRAMTEAIAAFERTEVFAPFDSKYDRFLRGEVALTQEEELGRLLFFSQQFTNCNLCHQLRTSPVAADETFSNYEYHNIGVPENRAVRSMTGVTGIDHGLLANPEVDDPATDGKFKVPTLRNVAVTGPYMHNGVFGDLRTVVLFYNMYNTKTPEMLINPETGAPFAPPEVPDTLSMEELTHGPALDDKRIDALVAFMKTLTDARYEYLLE
ncbi:cytochrome-c peroxidase [Sinisalibacter aestuarii]|uniref:Methylamine utilization protein MauG n=1 Tax=Sinisalibacter aestuarii TaxID=2949426 RepID=A0ABQ5LPV3_9RHOB|nr:cytochrome c peroxidase [Sinisalibacter aestuarii]GKY87001.1 methylamine utilization protein MauG [Sinisalibacter aestuarii]